MKMVFLEDLLYFMVKASNIEWAAYHWQQYYIVNSKLSAGTQELSLVLQQFIKPFFGQKLSHRNSGFSDEFLYDALESSLDHQIVFKDTDLSNREGF